MVRSGLRRAATIFAVLGIVAVGLVAAPASDAAPARGNRTIAALPAPVDAASVGDRARAPMGWSEFCRRNGADCTLDTREPERIALDGATWALIARVNREINQAIEPVTDQDQWGVVERWSYPDSGRGDCEDYALLKRRALAEAGLPRRALLMTVVIDETGGGHAILTVRTDRGDFILDNKRGAILAWSETGYRFVKRESQAEAAWVAMDTSLPTLATAAR